MKNKVYLFDTTLRDGEQAPGCQLNTIEKIEIARALEKLGIDVIEAGFPISSPGDFQSVVEISKAVKEPIICALTRAVKKDIDAAAESLKFAKHGRIHTGIGASDTHIKYKFNSTREEILSRGVEAVKYAKKFVEDVEFYAEDAGRADLPFLAQMIEAVIKAGATVVNIPDTTGYCLPDEYGSKIKYLIDHVANIDKAIISVHCHNDLGMATANALSGIINGARQVEGTINGVGERAGNTALEEIAMAIRTNKALKYTTGVVSQKIYDTSRLVSRLMHMPVQANKAIVGANAFSHSSGIHQDGVLKMRENYEIIDPKDVGIDTSSIILTARSGRAALKHRLEKIGYPLSAAKLDELYTQFLLLADKKKEVNDEDLHVLMGAQVDEGPIKILLVEVVCGYPLQPMATIKLEVQGETYIASASGNGPVDSTYKAVDAIVVDQAKLLKKPPVLKEFLIQAVTNGSDDVCRVNVQCEKQGNVYYGRGGDTDIVVASVQAYVQSLNRILKKIISDGYE